MVAREGAAPSISGCRPDVMLFHHRARGFAIYEGRFTSAASIWNTARQSQIQICKSNWLPRLDSHQDRRGQSPVCCGLHHEANGMVEPEVVATSPYRIKSPVPVCCGFDSMKMVLAAGLAPALATPSTSCLCIGLRERTKWILPPVLPRREFSTKEIRRLLQGGEVAVRELSQSPVLPRTKRAYETHVSAGSTAELDPSPGVAPG